VVNKFLFLAYAFVWILFMLYAWSLSRRQSRLLRELEDLKARMGSTDRSTAGRDEEREARDEQIR
jgi:CcmD family protein